MAKKQYKSKSKATSFTPVLEKLETYEVVRHPLKFSDKTYNSGEKVTEKEFINEFNGDERYKRIVKKLIDLGRLRKE